MIRQQTVDATDRSLTMRFTIQIVADSGVRPPVIHELAHLNREMLAIDTFGLVLSEAREQQEPGGLAKWSSEL